MKRAIVNTQLYDGISSELQAGVTIMWEDGVITQIGRDFTLPTDAEVIDAKGRFVTPGLIDSFSMTGLKEYGIRWEGDDSNEASGTIQPHLSVVDGINPFDTTFEFARKYGVTTAHIAPGPQAVIGGKTAIVKTVGNVIDEMVVKRDHGLAVSFGEVPKGAYKDKHKVPLTRMRIAYLLREQLRKATYDSTSEAYQEEILQKVLRKEAPVYIRAHRADDMITALRIQEEFDIDVVLVHGTEAYKLLDELVESSAKVIAGPFYNPKSRDELKNLHPSTTKKIADAHIPYTLTSNAVRNVSLEAALSVREGVSFTNALHSITLGAAEVLGIDKTVGSLEVGKEADLVIWDGQPLEFKTNVTETIIGGSTVYERKEGSR